MSKSPHEILGVAPNATADEIKKAYRKKARENHPDLNPNDPAAAKRMNEINDAYDRLSNPEKYAARPGSSQGSGGARNPYGSGYSGSGYGRSQNTGYGGYGSSRNTGYGGSGYGGSRGSGNEWGGQGDGWYGGFDFDDLFGFGTQGGSSATIRPEPIPTDSTEFRAAINYINTKQHKQAVEILNTVVSTGRNARWYYLSSLANNGAGNSLTALEQIRTAVRMDPQRIEYQQAQRSFQQGADMYQYESEARGFNMSFMNPGLVCCGCLSAQYFCQMFGFGLFC